jgi:hypothetical protein
MKRILVLTIMLLVFLVGCVPDTTQTNRLESEQQQRGVMAIVQNQPIPDLGGYSSERDIVIQTYLARNQTVATYAYTMTYDGKVIELCPSIGYPIPYSTQLTAPEVADYYSAGPVTVPQSEPNGLYPPGNSAATLVSCVNPDGSVSPTYFELDVFAMPYRIVSDWKLVRVDDKSSFSVDLK